MKTLIAEARARLAGLVDHLRVRRDYRAQLHAEVAVDIVADVERARQRAASESYTAEQADLEAARLLHAAQSPASPGGRAITPAEAAPILGHITASARHDGALVRALADT